MYLAKGFAEIFLDEEFVIQRISMSIEEGFGKCDQIARIISENGWKAFETPMPEIFAKLVRNSEGLVIDVGANSGFYSLLSAATKLNVKTIAFEPDPHVRQLLEKNITANKMENRIEISHLALTDKIGTGKLYIPTQEHGLVETSSSLESTFKNEHSEIIEIPTATLDFTLRERDNIFQKVDVIKIDVEGHEASVIRGAKNIINIFRPFIFIEILPRADLRSINNFVKDNRYKDITFPPCCAAQVGEQVLFDPSSWNHLLVPMEKIDKIAFCL